MNPTSLIDAVAFDLDGVLVDSEPLWEDVRRRFTLANGGRWSADAQKTMMGMSSGEWAHFMAATLGVELPEPDIIRGVVDDMAARYRDGVPLLPGAVDAVHRLAARWSVGLASSANRPLIDIVLRVTGLDAYFATTVSSEEVARGKPAPDVFLEAARRMGADPRTTAAIEDSHNGILAARAAGMATIALPNHEFPPGDDALEQAQLILESLDELTVDAITRLDR